MGAYACGIFALIAVAVIFMLTAGRILFVPRYFSACVAAFVKALGESSFNAVKKYSYGYSALCIDTSKKQWAVQQACLDGSGKKFVKPDYMERNVTIYEYGDLLDFELVDDGLDFVIEKTKGGAGNLFGPLGSIPEEHFDGYLPLQLYIRVMDGGKKQITLDFIPGYDIALPFNDKRYWAASRAASNMMRALKRIRRKAVGDSFSGTQSV